MSVAQHIQTRLEADLAPLHLEVANESDQHSVPPDSETHFRVVVVSEAFAGQRRVARHQRIYGLLEAQLQGPVHALALHLFTPEEWQARQQSAPASPDCLGGSKADSGA